MSDSSSTKLPWFKKWQTFVFIFLAAFIVGIILDGQLSKPTPQELNDRNFWALIDALSPEEIPKSKEGFRQYINRLNAELSGVDINSLPPLHKIYAKYAQGISFMFCVDFKKGIEADDCGMAFARTLKEIELLIKSDKLSSQDKQYLVNAKFEEQLAPLKQRKAELYKKWLDEADDFLKQIESDSAEPL